MAGKATLQMPVQDEDEETDLRDDLEIDDPEDDLEADEPEPPEEPPARRESDIERQARELGWHPRDEYLGPPHRWVDAETFMKRGQEVLPVMRDNNKRLLERVDRQNQEIQTMKASLAEQSTVLKDLREMARTANERGYQRAMDDLKKQQREAVAAGDMEAFDQVTEQIEEVVKTRAKPTDEAPPPKPNGTDRGSQELAPEVRSFVQANPWYMEDQMLNHEMQAEHMRLVRTQPELSLAENLAKAAETVKRRNPDKFGRQAPAAPRRPSNVLSPTPGNQQTRQRRGSPIDQIADAGERAVARKTFERFKRQMPDYTEEDYMSVYSNPNADILSVRKEKRK